MRRSSFLPWHLLPFLVAGATCGSNLGGSNRLTILGLASGLLRARGLHSGSCNGDATVALTPSVYGGNLRDGQLQSLVGKLCCHCGWLSRGWSAVMVR